MEILDNQECLQKDYVKDDCESYIEGTSVQDRINSVIYNTSCKTNDSIKMIRNNKVQLARESGFNKYSDKYADEVRNVWEIYAREAHLKYKKNTKNYKSSLYGQFKQLRAVYGFGDAFVAFIQGLIPALTASGLILLLKSSDKKKEINWSTTVIFLSSSVLPVYGIFLFNLRKWLLGRTMKHSPLIPFLLGTLFSLIYIYTISFRDLELINNKLNTDVTITFLSFTFVLFLITIFMMYYYTKQS